MKTRLEVLVVGRRFKGDISLRVCRACQAAILADERVAEMDKQSVASVVLVTVGTCEYPEHRGPGKSPAVC